MQEMPGFIDIARARISRVFPYSLTSCPDRACRLGLSTPGRARAHRLAAPPQRCRAEGKQLGRRVVEQSKAKKVKQALALRSPGIGIRRIAREVGLGVGTVIRLVDQAPISG